MIIVPIPVTLWLPKRTALGGCAAASTMRTVVSLPIAPNPRLLTVAVSQGDDRRWLALGVTPGSITALHTMAPQAEPPNQVIVGLSLFLTFFVKGPTIAKLYAEAYQPLAENRTPFNEWIALLLIAMLLFTNLVLGPIARVAQQLQICAIGFPITVGVGLPGVLATLPLMATPFTAALERMLVLIQ